MKKTQTIIVMLVILVAYTTKNGYSQTKIGGNIGLSIPNGFGADGSGSGLGLNARALFPLSDVFYLGGNIGYHTAANIHFMPISLAGEYLFDGDDLRMYLGLDIGMYRSSQTYTIHEPNFSGSWSNPTYTNSSYSISETNLGWAPHGGIYLTLSDNLDFNADLKYNTVAIGDGLAYKYIDLSVGLFLNIYSSHTRK